MRTSGEAVLSPCRSDEAEFDPRGSDEAEFGPRGPDEVESSPRGSDKVESGPRGSDEAESLRSCSIGNVIGTYQLYLIGYPSSRSPIVAPEPLGDSGRIARGCPGSLESVRVCQRVRVSAPDGCSPL